MLYSPNVGYFIRCMEQYDAVPGIIDPTDPKCPSAKAWRKIERAALITACTATDALIHAGLVDDSGKLTALGRKTFSKEESAAKPTKRRKRICVSTMWAIKVVKPDMSVQWITDILGTSTVYTKYRRLWHTREEAKKTAWTYGGKVVRIKSYEITRDSK